MPACTSESDNSIAHQPILFIAQDQELTADEHIRRRFTNTLLRAGRHGSRFKSLDVIKMQQSIHEYLLSTQLQVDGVFMGLLDLMNTAHNNGSPPTITPENSHKYLTMANMVTLNGIYFYQLLKQNGFLPLIIQNYSLEKKQLASCLAKKPLAVALSSTFIYLDDVKNMAREIKVLFPDVPVVVGGALVKKILNQGPKLGVSTKEWLNGFRDYVDVFVVEAQGEQTFLKLLEMLRMNTDWKSLPNLAFNDGGQGLTFTGQEEEPISMNQTSIAWNLIPRTYLKRTLPVNTSRGCLYNCRFCTYRKLVRGIHYKSLECLCRELRLIEDLGFVNHVRFVDDNFTANPKRLMDILKMMIEQGFSFSWSSFARADTLTPEVVRLMRDSRCDFLDMGIESGSQKILTNMDKKLSVDTIRRAIEALNENGIYGAGAFIIGFPGETEETVQETVDLINSTGLPFYHLNLFYYSSDMIVYSQRQEYELEGIGLTWKHKTMDSVNAARSINEMMGQIHGSYTDGLTSTWETFKILRGEGYSPPQIQELYRLKEKIGLHAQNNRISGKDSYFIKMMHKINEINPKEPD